MKKPVSFMKIVVVVTLLTMPVAVAIFAVLQLKTGLEPSPYLMALAPIGAAELAFTSALKCVERWRSGKEEPNEESEEENDV